MEMFYNAQVKQRQALWQEWLPGKRASKNALGILDGTDQESRRQERV